MDDIQVHPARVTGTTTDHQAHCDYYSQRSGLRVSPCLDCGALGLRRANVPAPACCPRCGSVRLVTTR